MRKVLGGLVAASVHADRARHPEGAAATAHCSPDGARNVLEGKTPATMLLLLPLACVYPGIALRALLARGRKPAPRAACTGR